MEIEQVAEMARAVAALPQAERDYFEGMVADERAAAAEAKRIAKLRAMDDYAVVGEILRECTDHADSYDNVTASRMLKEAGFARGQPKQKIAFIFPEGLHIEIYGTREALGAVRHHLCDAIPGLKYSKGA